MTLPELLAWIERYDMWVYGLLLAYALAKTGPLPMVAGYAAAQGALRVELLLLLTVLGSILGAQLRFAAGRFVSPWVLRNFPRLAPWVALASAGVERYSGLILCSYRFAKGSFTLVGLGAGASLLPWLRHLLLDGLGAMLWAGTVIAIGYSLGSLGLQLDPRWAAYVGLSLLVISIIALALLGKQLKRRLLPLAERILIERTALRTS